MSYLRILTILGVMLLGTALYGQRSQARNEGRGLLLHLGYGPQLPLGDLADRFGTSYAMEAALDLITTSDWIIGAHSQYLFGSAVKDDVLAGLRTTDGLIIGNDRSPAALQLRQRGTYLGVRVGRIISLLPNNPRAGIRWSVGAGWLAHRIRVQYDPARSVNQVLGDYRAGYDRLTAGPTLYQFLGWQTLGREGRFNFYIGIEAFQSFSKAQRSVDFATQQLADGATRLDALLGLRVGWVLPFYLRDASEIYY